MKSKLKSLLVVIAIVGAGILIIYGLYALKGILLNA